MEVDELQAIRHLVLFEQFQRFQEFAGIDAEFADVAPGFLPFAAAGAGELDADTDIGLHAHLFGEAGDGFQFDEFFHHEVDAAPHFLRQQRQFDVALVLVAVADNHGVVVDVDGKDGMQFRFGAGFQPDVEFVAVADDFLHDGAHLIDFDGVDDEVLRGVAVFFGGGFEAVGYFLDAVVEDVRETQQHGCGNVAHLQLFHQLLQVDGRASGFRCHGNVAFLVD